MNETANPADNANASSYAAQEGENDEPSAIEVLGPPKVDLSSVGLSSLGSLAAGFIGGIVIFVAFIFFLKATRIASPGIFPYALGIIGFFANLITSYLTLTFNRLVFPNKYKEGMATFGQTFILSILVFVLVVPLYAYVGMVHEERLVFVFVTQILMSTLGVSLISEILSNYRYALLSVYSSFTGFFISAIASVAVFLNFGETDSMIYALVGTILVVNFMTNTVRVVVEFVYYSTYHVTGVDPLGDIYAKVEAEDREAVAQAEAALTKFQ